MAQDWRYVHAHGRIEVIDEEGDVVAHVPQGDDSLYRARLIVEAVNLLLRLRGAIRPSG
jgi:hypothetical protein